MGCPHIDRCHCCIKPHGGPPLQWLHWELPWRLAQADFLLEGKKRCQVGTNLQNQQFPITPDFSNLGISNSLYTQTAIVYISCTSLERGHKCYEFYSEIVSVTNIPNFAFFQHKGNSFKLHPLWKKKKHSQDLHFVRIPPPSLTLKNKTSKKICLRHAILPQVLLVWRGRSPMTFAFLRIRLWSLAL